MNAKPLILLPLVAALAAPAAGQINPPVDPAKLVIQHSQQCVDSSGGRSIPGTRVMQVPCCSGKTGSQTWDFAATSTVGVFKLVTGNCMAVSGGSTAAGAAIVLAECVAAGTDPAQLWRLLSTPTSGVFLIVNQKSGRCLEVPGSSTATGTQLVQRNCATAAPNQRFKLVAPPA